MVDLVRKFLWEVHGIANVSDDEIFDAISRSSRDQYVRARAIQAAAIIAESKR